MKMSPLNQMPDNFYQQLLECLSVIDGDDAETSPDNMELIKRYRQAGLRPFANSATAMAFLRNHSKLKKLLAVKDFWLRPLSHWQPKTTESNQLFVSLLQHLLLRYQIPSFLLQFVDAKQIIWLIILGQGGSLRRAAKVFDWIIPKSFIGQFWTVPDDFSFREAVQWVEVHRLGWTITEFAKIQHMIAELDFTEHIPHHEEDKKFWRDTLLWLGRYRDELHDDNWYVIRDWALHMHTEKLRIGRFFSWHGRTPATAFIHAQRYAQNGFVTFDQKLVNWRGKKHGWDWRHVMQPFGAIYTITELINSEDLQQEGCCMHHCIATYGNRCQQGECSIFSMAINGVRQLTIEIDPISLTVKQVRGKNNRLSTIQEQQIIKLWLEYLHSLDSSVCK